MNYGFVYETTNLINGKKYIGKHKRSQDLRDPDDSWYLGSGKLILQAIDKYGTENFSRKILCECVDEEDLQEKERYYISLYNAVDNPTYYNLVHDANPPVVYGEDNYFHTHIFKGESNPFYGRHHTEESRQKISDNHSDVSGESNPFYGKTHSKESKLKISESRKLGISEGRISVLRGDDSPSKREDVKQKIRESCSDFTYVYKDEERSLKIHKTELGKYLSLGYSVGRGKNFYTVPKVFKEKFCSRCKKIFKPISSNQKICDKCNDNLSSPNPIKRICNSCGKEFPIRSNRSQYCDNCILKGDNL